MTSDDRTCHIILYQWNWTRHIKDISPEITFLAADVVQFVVSVSCVGYLRFWALGRLRTGARWKVWVRSGDEIIVRVGTDGLCRGARECRGDGWWVEVRGGAKLWV